MQIQPEKADQMDSARACIDIQTGTEGFQCAALI
jgi:hypothetical protein